jgi:hypothetical protein
MSDETPPKLDYRPPEPRRTLQAPAGGSVRGLLLGLAIGSAVSALFWIAGWDTLVEHGSGIAVYLLPLAKAVAAVFLLAVPGWRSFGTGLLLSIAVGALIFFGTCAANFKV